MIWKFIEAQITQGNAVMLLVVISSTGSSPGRAGFKMAISENGEMHGSIGGGSMEYDLSELAKTSLEKGKSLFLKKQNHKPSNSEDSSGMICSGSQMVAFYPLKPKDIKLIASIKESANGLLEYSERGIHLLDITFKSTSEKELVLKDTKWTFYESLESMDRLYVFGGGHVSLALCKIMQDLNFHISVLDDRNEDLLTLRNNTFADEKRIIQYENASSFIKEGYNNYVVIMTFGHKSDEVVLREVLHCDNKYIGMMGSPAKVKSIFTSLVNTGISKSLLDKIYAPIGIGFKSDTPAEIAISIAAQILAVKKD